MKYLILVLLLISPLRLLAEKKSITESEKKYESEVGMAAGYNFINEIDNVELEGFSSNLIIGVASTHFDKWLIDGSLEIIVDQTTNKI